MLLQIFKYGLSCNFLLQKLINNFLENKDKFNNQYALLLIQNGVYWVDYLKNSNDLDFIKMYALEQDVLIRKIHFLFEGSSIKLINYTEFVDLVLRYNKNINW